jgi:diketogulonate reductase-like aldo/keto reductase
VRAAGIVSGGGQPVPNSGSRLLEPVWEAAAITGPFSVLAGLQQEGLIRHLGVSNVSAEQVAAAQSVAPVVAVQNLYHLAVRSDDTLVDQCAEHGIAFVPFFPLGGFGRCSPACWTRSPLGWASPAGRSRWPGCCSNRR